MTKSRLVSSFALVLLSASSVETNAGSWASTQFSTAPSVIRLVGASSGTPDAAAGQFTAVARDRWGSPLNGCSVVVDFSNCPDLLLSSDPLDPDALVNCEAKTIRKFTDVQGRVTFTIPGSSTGAGAAQSLANSVRMYGNGVLFASPSFATYDLDGSGGVGAGDLSAWLTDFGTGTPYSRSDFNGDGIVGADDLSDWLRVFGAGNSVESPVAGCP